MKALEKVHEISKRLVPFGIEAAQKEAESLVEKELGLGLLDLYRDNPELNEIEVNAIEDMAGRRSRREPLQYILGRTDFLGLKVMVGQGVLIPRPETELMAEQAIDAIKRLTSVGGRRASKEDPRTTPGARRPPILDLCTGSGCLALALAKEFSGARVFGVDISMAALHYAGKNAVINDIHNVEFINGHLFSSLRQDMMFDLIISNPPYIKTDEIKGLQPEVSEWEPVGALDGGPDGLDFYREIIPSAREFLSDRGILMLELGYGCAADVEGMMNDAGYAQVDNRKDFAGIERTIQAKWIR